MFEHRNPKKYRKMKKVLFGTFLFFVMMNFAYAQLKLGVKLGATATNVNFNATTELNDFEFPTAHRMNFTGGVVAEFDLMEDLLGLRTSIEYARKGYNIDLDKFREKFNDIKKLSGDWYSLYDYLQLPVNLVYKLDNFSINAGPYLAYGLGGTEMADLKGELNDGTEIDFSETNALTPVFNGIPENTTDIITETGVLKYYNGLDLGINIGFGFTLKDVLINVQYQQGLTNLTPEIKDDPDFNPSDLIAKNNVLSLELTYFIPFKK